MSEWRKEQVRMNIIIFVHEKFSAQFILLVGILFMHGQVAMVLLLLLRRSYGLFALEINQLQNYYYYYYHPVNGIRVDAIESSSSSLVQSWLHHKTTALHLPRLWVGISISVHRY